MGSTQVKPTFISSINKRNIEMTFPSARQEFFERSQLSVTNYNMEIPEVALTTFDSNQSLPTCFRKEIDFIMSSKWTIQTEWKVDCTSLESGLKPVLTGVGPKGSFSQLFILCMVSSCVLRGWGVSHSMQSLWNYLEFHIFCNSFSWCSLISFVYSLRYAPHKFESFVLFFSMH